MFGSLWEKQPVVIMFLRRWGCPLCVSWACQIEDHLKPDLDEMNVATVVIGVEELGVKTFIDRHYFSGGKIYKFVFLDDILYCWLIYLFYSQILSH